MIKMAIKNKLPLVSICCATYNHENYIKQALEGFLMQIVNFSIEIIVHDDASIDNTSNIIREYAKQHPQIITIIQPENLMSKGLNPTIEYCLLKAQGKYIALCDGDDYWTDPLKLQKQVDFLEQNEDYVMCTHVANEINEVLGTEHVFPIINQNSQKNIEDYILSNLTATCSLVFRTQYSRDIPEWFNTVKFGDLGLMLLLFYRSKKKMMILKDCMSDYRVHSGGIHGSLKNNNDSLIKAYKMHLEFIKIINDKLFLGNKFQDVVLKKKINTYSMITKLYKEKSNFFFCIYKLRVVLLGFKYKLFKIKLNEKNSFYIA